MATRSDVLGRPAIDVAAVSDWILGLGLGARGPVRFERLGRGQSNLTYMVFDRDGRRWVLRRPPLGELLASAHDISREYRVLKGLGRTPVPAPEAIAVCGDPSVTDVPLMLIEHVQGVTIDRPEVAGSIPEGDRGQIGLALAQTLGVVHGADLGPTGLSELSHSRTPYAVRQVRRWRGQWERSARRSMPAMERLADRLLASAPKHGETTLVHGDYHLMNVIFEPGGARVRAVLDWELCTLGDPLADLGCLLSYWPRPGDRGDAFSSAPSLPGFPSREEMAAAYAEATGRSLEVLPFWHCLGLWKVAIIGEGVLRRIETEPRNVPPGGPVPERLVEDLLDRALAVAAEAGI